MRCSFSILFLIKMYSIIMSTQDSIYESSLQNTQISAILFDLLYSPNNFLPTQIKKPRIV